MATNKVAVESPNLDCSGRAGDGDCSGPVKTLQVPGKCGPPATAATPSKDDSLSALAKVLTTVQSHQPACSAVTAPGPRTPSPIMVIAKVAAAGGMSANEQPQVTNPALSQVVSMSQATTPGRTVVITLPRTGAPQPVPVAARLPSATAQLPANVQIPPGMMLIRSDSGQLILVSQQALAQAPQIPRVVSVQAPRVLAPQITTAAGIKSNEKVTVIRMAAPPSFQTGSVQKTGVVKVIGVASKPALPTLSAVSELSSQPLIHMDVTETKESPTTFSQETLESVKKCKNFLVTLIKLASSDSRSANMANNVRELVKRLLEGKLEAEEFTQQLYCELKSTPQPCLVPFLKKSLPAVRLLTSDPQLFIQQASTSARNPNTLSSTLKQSLTETEPSHKINEQVIQQPRRVTLTPGFTTFTQSRNCISKSSRPAAKLTAVQSVQHFTGPFLAKRPFIQDPPRFTKFTLKDSSGYYKEDDDINDVASMAGVNLKEENAQILTTMVGSVVQSCQDQPFLSPNPVLSRILHRGQPMGVTDVGPEVVALVSHATQECLRGLLEKLTVMLEHRKAGLKDDPWHANVSDTRSQLRFLEEVETIKKKKKDEEEREKLLHLAKSRSNIEDQEYQELRQRAKELQQMEEAQLQQREANLTALAAIGPRRKRPLEQTDCQMSLLPRQGVQRVTRVILRDLLVCMEQNHLLRHSLTLYKAML